MRATMQPLLYIGFHWPSFHFRLLKIADNSAAKSHRHPPATKTRNGHVRGRVMSNHDLADHSDIGSAPV